jgi:hypothetical protein
LHLEDGNVERATAQIVDGNDLGGADGAEGEREEHCL